MIDRRFSFRVRDHGEEGVSGEEGGDVRLNDQEILRSGRLSGDGERLFLNELGEEEDGRSVGCRRWDRRRVRMVRIRRVRTLKGKYIVV